MQVMVVYMYDVREVLQGILLLIVCLVFLAIQVANRKAYFNPELNSVNLQIQMMIFVWTFTRVVIRTSALDEETLDTKDELESSRTGLPLGEEYNAVSRSTENAHKDNFVTFFVLMLPVIIQMIQI